VSYLIGVDVGTTNVKAALYDVARGNLVAIAKRPTITLHPRPEWSEFDADAVWSDIADCLREIAASARQGSRSIAGIAVASMGEAGLPLGRDGTPLYPIMAWYDARGEAFVPRWEATVGADRVYAITGQPLGGLFGINKLMWFSEHRPDLREAMACWLSVEDYVLWRLSGTYATDHSVAARTMAFSPPSHAWSETMLAAAGVPRELMPAPFPSGTCIGTVTAAAAEVTGVPIGTPVVTGGHDHLCGALAVGLLGPGALLDSTGTSQAILTVTRDFVRHPSLARARHASYNYVVPET
jgi:xylulokinase